jgi:putative phosphotransacetylase
MYFFKFMEVKIEVSARHIHLKQADIDVLFGANYEFQSLRKLSQGQDFAAQETVVLRNNDKEFKVRVVGPTRNYSQVEISYSDAIYLGIDAPLRLSGNLEGVPAYEIEGPVGKVKVPVIVAKRHLHIPTSQAQEMKLQQGDIMKVKVVGERSLVFNEVIVRIQDDYTFACHLDTDEGNACGIQDFGQGELII